MRRFVNPGNTAFEVAVNSQIYVDKTGLLAYTNSVINTKQALICSSRPRRFGKSITADMLCAYYSRGCDSDSIFASYEIAKSEAYKKYLNQYDVIKVNIQEFLSMTGSMDEMLSMLKKYLVFDLMEHFDDVRFRDESNLIQVMRNSYAKTKQAFVILIDGRDGMLRAYCRAPDP